MVGFEDECILDPVLRPPQCIRAFIRMDSVPQSSGRLRYWRRSTIVSVTNNWLVRISWNITEHSETYKTFGFFTKSDTVCWVSPHAVQGHLHFVDRGNKVSLLFYFIQHLHPKYLVSVMNCLCIVWVCILFGRYSGPWEQYLKCCLPF